MPGCGCAPTGRRVSVPQQRGYLPKSSPPRAQPSPPDAPNIGQETASVGTASEMSAGNASSEQKSNITQGEVSTGSNKVFKAPWKSPLRTFDTFASKILKDRADAEEDYPKLSMPPFRGLHKCKVSALNYHQVDLAIELEQELRNIGIQGTMMMDMLEKLLKAEAACQFQGAVRAAELAAMAAPTGLAEEAAVAASRGYSVDAHQFSKMASGENPIEIVGYIGCTRPDNF